MNIEELNKIVNILPNDRTLLMNNDTLKDLILTGEGVIISFCNENSYLKYRGLKIIILNQLNYGEVEIR